MLCLYHYMYLLMYEQLGNRFPMFESFYIPSGYSHNLYLTLKPIIQRIISRSICFIPSIPKIKQIIKAPTYIELHVCWVFCYLLLSVLLLLAAALSLFTSPTILTAYFPPLSHTAMGALVSTSFRRSLLVAPLSMQKAMALQQAASWSSSPVILVLL